MLPNLPIGCSTYHFLFYTEVEKLCHYCSHMQRDSDTRDTILQINHSIKYSISQRDPVTEN